MGMKMRLNLAIAIVDQPKLVILDEPTNGLDPEAVFRLRREIEEIRQRGSAVLISSHQLSEVEKIADRIVAIDDGMVCFDGKLDDLSDRFENLEEFYKICMEQIRNESILQNEIRLFFSRKNYLVWIVGVLAVVLHIDFTMLHSMRIMRRQCWKNWKKMQKILRSGNLSIRGSAWNYGGQ